MDGDKLLYWDCKYNTREYFSLDEVDECVAEVDVELEKKLWVASSIGSLKWDWDLTILEVVELSDKDSLFKNVSYLIYGGYMCCFELIVGNFFFKKMEAELNVLGPSMKNWNEG